MNLDEHLLVTLGEEAAELQLVIAKALRFGLDDDWRDATYTESPRKLIQKEFNDLYATAELLAQRGVLDWPLLDMNVVEMKKLKIRRFLEYARERGTLQPDDKTYWPDGEGSTGCADDNDALSRSLRRIRPERLDEILREELGGKEPK